jgi:hypothetical protein
MSVGDAVEADYEYAEPGETVFRFAAPITGTEDPAETWLPGRMDTRGSASLWPTGIYLDPVIAPVPEPLDWCVWPCCF